ncbi:D-alanyl-D-alanine carboxypeptidase [Secundilactobacillus oryzae JCM 18671]|uniref:serine-type D-Ala-D-Ala carboxypeptidase n=1 Tax=Secundilactobacillus oryzae JCM 18671 TaxID=1291743 RepID=A0A081BHV8_9LACO|nr:D-alanyl-D-alanine carboxypeptidase family protein [Secundilactobacillus oryzae]GAK47626.1 D-alanyl-D-alanine carboxypeptidase [Secundilactobacillus oryzae JCM 18671]
MFKSVKKLGTILATTLMVATAGVSLPTATTEAATAEAVTTVNLKAKAGLAIDAKTGQILYDKNSKQVLPAASMSKLLAIYIVLENIHSGKLKWDQKISIDNTIYKMSQNKELSNVSLRKDKTYTVKELYQASVIYSANAAITALGNAISGTPHAFVNQMRSTAKKLGIKDAKIYSASGLTNKQVGDAGYDDVADSAENEFSARDMGKLSMALLNKYPEVLETTSITRLSFQKGTDDEIKMENWNWMLPGLAKAYKELPVDGLKTGTSDAAGANFTGTVKKNGHRIITVVMGASHKSDTDTSRFTQTQHLMSYVFQNFKTVTYKSSQIDGVKSVTSGNAKETTVKTNFKTPLTLWIRDNQVASNATGSIKIKKSLNKDNKLIAPVKKGQTIGTANVSLKGDKLGFVSGKMSASTPVTAATKVEKANIFVRMWRGLISLF